MTQHEKILRYLLKNPHGMTMRDGYLMYINSPHKRVAELEEMGVKISHTRIESPGGSRIVLYRLEDPGQERISEILRRKGARNEGSMRNV